MFISDPKKHSYRHIIIGSGPAGISLALGLEKKITGRILIVESGGLENNPKIQQLSSVNATGDLSGGYYAAHSQRIFGGTSTVWRGLCAVLEERSFLNNEWPINYGDIYPYYKEAAKILELPAQAYEKPFVFLNEQKSLIYKPFFISPSEFQAPPVRFNLKYHDYLAQSQNIDVLLNTTCQKVNIDNHKVSGLSLISSTKKSSAYFIPAKSITLACGGTGNPKILESSLPVNNKLPVGNYYMGHPHIYKVGRALLSKNLFDKVQSNHSTLDAIQLSDQFCINNNLLSMSVSFRIESEDDFFIAGEKQTLYNSKLIIRSEMKPIYTNKIYNNVLEKNHSLAQPKQVADFYFNNQENDKKSWGFVSKELLTSEIGRLSEQVSVKTNTGGGHHIGTTRMGADKKTSVVNKNCEVHDIKNLFVAGSSIFPASAASNPTFSIVAFSLRLSEYLLKRL